MTIQVTNADGVLTLTIDRPKGRNSLDDVMVDTMITELERAQNDESVRVILITSTGDDFCTGFDIVGRNENIDGLKPGSQGSARSSGGCRRSRTGSSR